jgi:hypothetical protein
VSSPEFWKRPERVVASTDPDTATAQTIRIMCGHIPGAARDEGFRATADQAFGQFGQLSGVGGDDPRSFAGAAWWWCKTFIKFVHHENILRQRLGESGHLQGLICPDVLVRMDEPEGDCAIFSECLCAFLRVFGIPYELVTVAVNPNEPEVFSHVYVYAVMPDGSRLPLDASHGQYPGWQVPSSDVFRRQVWDAAGNPTADHGSRFDGLHNYGLRGMGDVDLSQLYPAGSYGGVDPTPVAFDPLPTDYYNPTQVFGPGVADSSFGAPSAPGFNWGGLFANLANQWTQIGGRVVAPQTTMVRGPNGQLMYSSPAVAGAPGVLPSLVSSSSSWVWVAGAAALGLLVFAGMKK